MAPEEESAEDGLGENVKDTVEDSFRVRCDDVATLAHAPRNGIDAPKTDDPDSAHGVELINICAECGSVAATVEDNRAGNDEEGNDAKDEKSPFVGAVNQGTDQTSDNHDLIDQDCDANSRPWKASGQEKVEEQ